MAQRSPSYYQGSALVIGKMTAVAYWLSTIRDSVFGRIISLLVRSHEVKEDGYEVAHGGYCVTIFSAPNYW